MARLTVCQRKHFHVSAKLERGGSLRLGGEGAPPAADCFVSVSDVNISASHLVAQQDQPWSPPFVDAVVLGPTDCRSPQ